VLLLVAGYKALATSDLFELRRVEVEASGQAIRDDVEKTVRRAAGEARLLEVDLDSIRQRVEALPRVRAASVARMLPDGICVRVFEREPAVLTRRESGALIWLDVEAVEMGEFSSLKYEGAARSIGEAVPPVAVGFAEGARSQAAMAEDRERIALYKQIESELSQASLWSLVDEIDLTYTKNANLRLANSIIRVVVGSKDFKNRLETALKILKAIEEGDTQMLGRYRVQDPERLIENAQNINFIDTARADRIVLNFSTPGTEKRVRQEPKKVTGDKAQAAEKKA
jgi:cell division septal protein FtsQ